MLIEEALRTYLVSKTAVTALVGTRIYPMVAPQSPTLPFVVYNRLSGSRVNNLTGSSGVAGPRFSFDVVAATFSTMAAAAEQIRLALSDYVGALSGVSQVQINFLGDRHVLEGEGLEAVQHLFRAILEFEVWHVEGRAAA